MDLYRNIKAIRSAKGVSQAEIARRLDLDPSAYHRLEHRGNKLSIEQATSIATALGVSLWELLSLGEEPGEVKTTEVKPEELKKIEKDLSKTEELLEYQRDKIKYFKFVVARYVIEEAWQEYIDSSPDSLLVAKNEETGNYEWAYDEQSWESYLSGYIYGSTNFWKLFESGLLDNQTLKEVEKRRDMPVPLDIRLRQAKLKKEADKLFGKADDQ